MKNIYLLPFAALAALTSARSAEPENLDETIVLSTDGGSLTVPSLEEARQMLDLVPGGTEVIDPERYLTGRSSTVNDIFALSPGVIAESRFGSDEARLSIRGSGLQRTFHGRGIRYLQDGVPLNLADGGFDFQSVDPLTSEYVEVWRGGNALAYGSSTLGGAINYVSKTGRSAPGYGFRVEGGSDAYLRAHLEGGFSEGSRDLYMSFSQQSQDGFRDYSEQNNQRLFSNFGIELSENAETRFYLTAINTDSELPGSLTKAEMNLDPGAADTSRFGAVNYDNHRDYQLVRLANITTLRQGEWVWDFTSAWSYKDLDHPITPFAGVIDQLSNDFLLGATMTRDGELFGRRNLLRSGVNFTYGETRAASLENVRGYRGAVRSKAEQAATNFEFFLEDQQEIGNGFTGILGVSAAYNIRDNDNLYNNPTANPPFYFPPAPGSMLSYRESYNNISPKVGLRWDGQDMQVFANVSGSYEPPSFSETVTGGVARDEQTATTFEVGTRGTRGFARWDVVAYYAAVENELLTVVDPVTLVSTTRNANDTIHAGIELGGAVDLLGQNWMDEVDHRLVLRGAWTYGDFRFDDDPIYGDNRIAGVAPHMIHLELIWEGSHGWYAGPTLEWASEKSYIDHRNTFAADPYATLGFKFGQRVNEGFSWFVEAKNLTDEIYAATHGVIENAGGTDQRQFLPGEGRSVYAGMEYRF